MKKAVFQKKKKFQRSLVLVSCFFLLSLSSCGLEDFPYLNPPYLRKSSPSYSNEAYENNYFNFQTDEGQSNIDNNIKGVEVYYKIFNSLSKMSSFQSTISSQNTTGNAANTLINTQNYKPLKISTGSFSPLIKINEVNNSGHYVYIRLTDYDKNSAFRSTICVCPGNNPIEMYDEQFSLKYNDEIVYPRRNINQSYTFNFGGDDPETDRVPLKDDEDVEWSDTHSTEDEDGKWYVDMYAVSVGLNITNWTPFYSSVLHLGTVSIKEGQNN